MAFDRRIGFGVTLEIQPDGSTVYTSLEIVDTIDGPETAADEIETTLRGDTFKKYEKGQVDPGQVTFDIAYDPDDTSTTVLTNLLTASGCALATFRLTYPITCNTTTTTQETFTGFVAGLGRSVPKDGLITMPVTIRVDGDPGFST